MIGEMWFSNPPQNGRVYVSWMAQNNINTIWLTWLRGTKYEGTDLKLKDLRMLLWAKDKNKDGQVDTEEFLDWVPSLPMDRGQMCEATLCVECGWQYSLAILIPTWIISNPSQGSNMLWRMHIYIYRGSVHSSSYISNVYQLKCI